VRVAMAARLRDLNVLTVAQVLPHAPRSAQSCQQLIASGGSPSATTASPNDMPWTARWAGLL